MKTLFSMLVMCLLATGIYAQRIAVKSGSIDFLKNEKILTVKFTYNNMRVGKMTEEDYVSKKIIESNDKEPGKGDNWYKMWIDDRSNRFEPKFIELFDKIMSDKRGIELTENDGNRYVMTVNTHFTEPGFNVGVARKNASVSLVATIIDTETGKEIAVIIIDNSSANNFMGMDFDVAYRIQESYAKAGRELAKFLVKKLKL